MSHKSGRELRVGRDAPLCLPRPASTSASTAARPASSTRCTGPARPSCLPLTAGALGMRLFLPKPGAWQYWLHLSVTTASSAQRGPIESGTSSSQSPSGRHSQHPTCPAPLLRALTPKTSKSRSQESLLQGADVACPAKQGTCLKIYCISRECNLLSLINFNFDFSTSSALRFVI